MKEFKGFRTEQFKEFDDKLISKYKDSETVHDLFIKEEILVVRFYK
jgi:hypothetical protein